MGSKSPERSPTVPTRHALVCRCEGHTPGRACCSATSRGLEPAGLLCPWDAPGKKRQGAGFLGGSVVKDPPATAGDTRGRGSVPGSGRSSAGGNGDPLHILAWRGPWTEQCRSAARGRNARSPRQRVLRCAMILVSTPEPWLQGGRAA